MIDLRIDANREENHENENPNKIFDIIKTFFNFNTKQKGKGLKMLTPKQMLQILPIAQA